MGSDAGVRAGGSISRLLVQTYPFHRIRLELVMAFHLKVENHVHVLRRQEVVAARDEQIVARGAVRAIARVDSPGDVEDLEVGVVELERVPADTLPGGEAPAL